MAEPIRIGFIGAGAIITRGHIPNFQRQSGVALAAICDTNLVRAQEAAAAAGIPNAYSDYRELCASPDVDAVVIGVPNAFHAPAAIAALEHGKHVLCEKPLATSVADGEQMVALAQQKGLVLAVNMSNRPRAEYVAIQQFIAAGHLGKPTFAFGRMMRRSGIPGYGSWFTRKELAGGGATMDIGVHVLDMVMWALGFPEITSVRGEVVAVHGPRELGLGGWGMDRVPGGTFDVDDYAAIHARMAGGGLVTVEVSWALHGRNEERIQIAGDQGGVDFFPDRYGVEQPLRFFRYEDGVAVEIIPTLPHTDAATVWGIGIGKFLTAVRGDGKPVADGADGLKVLRLLDATYRSAIEGRELPLG